MVKVLFVCLGNICRSPTAEGVFRKLVAERGLAHLITSDSAGLTDYHTGEPPDARAVEAARRRGVDLTDIRARQVLASDFEDFDLLLAMDRSILGNMIAQGQRAGADVAEERLRLFMDYAPDLDEDEVPDPYLAGPRAFGRVLDLIEAGARGLLDDITRTRMG